MEHLTILSLLSRSINSLADLNNIFSKNDDITTSLLGEIGFVIKTLSSSAGGVVHKIGSAISTIFQGTGKASESVLRGLGEGGGKLINAAGNSIGNIFNTFISPILNITQWLIIIGIITYLYMNRFHQNTNALKREQIAF